MLCMLRLFCRGAAILQPTANMYNDDDSDRHQSLGSLTDEKPCVGYYVCYCVCAAKFTVANPRTRGPGMINLWFTMNVSIQQYETALRVFVTASALHGNWEHLNLEPMAWNLSGCQETFLQGRW